MDDERRDDRQAETDEGPGAPSGRMDLLAALAVWVLAIAIGAFFLCQPSSIEAPTPAPTSEQAPATPADAD